MDPATRYTLRRNIASIMEICFWSFHLLFKKLNMGIEPQTSRTDSIVFDNCAWVRKPFIKIITNVTLPNLLYSCDAVSVLYSQPIARLFPLILALKHKMNSCGESPRKVCKNHDRIMFTVRRSTSQIFVSQFWDSANEIVTTVIDSREKSCISWWVRHHWTRFRSKMFPILSVLRRSEERLPGSISAA